MSTFQTIPVDSLSLNPFKLIGEDWMLITAEKNGKTNCMTASWGGLGVIWGKNVAYIFVRDSRYTKELIDGAETFSLSFLDHKQYGRQLSFLGSVSGRNRDKLAESHLTVSRQGKTPVIGEASMVLVCRKLCCQKLAPENFTSGEIDAQFYKDKDYHNLYIGEITEVLSRLA